MEFDAVELAKALLDIEAALQRETREPHIQRHPEFDSQQGLVQTARRRESNQGASRRLRGE